MLQKCFISLLLTSVVFFISTMEQAIAIPSLKHLAMDCLWSQSQVLTSNDKISQKLVEEFKEYKVIQFVRAVRKSNFCEFEKNLLINIFDPEVFAKNGNFFRHLYVKSRHFFEVHDIKIYKKILNMLQRWMTERVLNYFSCENIAAHRFIEAVFVGNADTVKQCLLDDSIDNQLIIVGMLEAATQGNTSIMSALGDAMLKKYDFASFVWLLSQSLSLAISYDKHNIVKFAIAWTWARPHHPEVRKMLYEALWACMRCGNRRIAELLCDSSLIASIATHSEGPFDLRGLASAQENVEIAQLLSDRIAEIESKQSTKQKEIKSLKRLVMDYFYEHNKTLSGQNIPRELIEEFTNYKDTWQSEVVATNKNFSELEQDFLKSIAENDKNNLKKEYGLCFSKYLYIKCKYLSSTHTSQAYHLLIETLEQTIPECKVDYYATDLEAKQQFLSYLFEDNSLKARELFQSNEEIRQDGEFIALALIIGVSKRLVPLIVTLLDHLAQMCKDQKITNTLLEDAVGTALTVAIGYDNQNMVIFLLRPYEYPAHVSPRVFYKSLVKCIHYHRTEIARLILQRYSLSGARNSGNNTDFLATAIVNGHLPMVKLLIAKGADFNRPDLLVIAAQSESVAVVKFLVENYDMSSQIDQALDTAVNRGYVPIVKYFVDKGAVNDAISGFKKCMTIALGNFAVKNPQTNLVEYAHSLGLDRSAVNEILLGIASCKGDVETLAYLIHNEGMTEPDTLRLALRTAFSHNHENVMNYLIKLGIHFEEKPILTFQDLLQAALAVILFNINAHVVLLPKILDLEQYSSDLIERLLTADDLHRVHVQNVKCLMEYLESPSQAFIEHVFTNGLEQGNIPLIEYFLTSQFNNIAWCPDDHALTGAIQQAGGVGQEKLKNYLIEYQQEKRRQVRMAAIEKRSQNNKEPH